MTSDWISPMPSLPVWRLSILLAIAVMSRMTSCTPVCPLFCKCDIYQLIINCSDGGLGDVPYSNSNDSFAWAESLIINGNHIFQISEQTFLSFGGLIDLSLANNQLQTITNGSFIGLFKLQRLDLSSNLLVDIPAAVAKLPNLRELIMSQNIVTRIDDTTFIGMKSLESLYLDQNNIHVIGTPFKILTSLRVLSMTSNSLDQDPVGWFSSNLRELYLSDNKLPLTTEVCSWFSTCDTVLPLKILKLTKNRIKSIQLGTFRKMFDLQMLHIGENYISFIDESSLHEVLSLVEIAINDNWLKNIPLKLFHNSTNLEVLKLDGNHLRSLQRRLFMNTKRLTILNASFNKIQSISAITDETFPSLTELNLASNRINEIQGHGFTSLPMLSTLIIGGNQLTRVPNVSDLYFLETLDLSSNAISYVPHTAFQGTSLSWILLNDNLFETIDMEPFDHLQYLHTLVLKNNPWWCDCLLLGLYMAQYPWVQGVYEDGFICAGPPQFEDAEMFTLEQDKLEQECPKQINGLIVLVVLSVWFGVVVIVIARMWIRKFCEVHKFKKVGKRNIRYSKLLSRKRRNGIPNNQRVPRTTFGRSDSFALILQNKDNDDHDDHDNNGCEHNQMIEIARVTTV